MAQFIVTNSGLAAASAASPSGPYVHITAFKLGADFATAPLATDINLIGAVVYTGTVASYSYYDATTIQVNLEVPSAAGPFTYGEVGLFLADGSMFARFSYGTARQKIASSLSGYSNAIRIKALIRLSQGPSIFSFSPDVVQTVLEVSTMALLQTPQDHPENPVIIVHEPNDYQDSLLVHKHSATLWSPDNYIKLGTTVVSAAADTTHVTAPLFASLLMAGSGNNGKYLLQRTGGYLRSVSALSGSTVTLSSAWDTTGLVGSTISVYQLESTYLADLAASIASSGASKVSKAGDIMTGLLLLSGNAVAALGAVPKQQLDAAIAGAGSTTGGLTANDTITFSSGHIVKYGSYAIGDFSPQNQLYPFTFPVAFPANCWVVLISARDEIGDNVAWLSYRLPSRFGFTFMINEATNDVQDIIFNYIAIGN